MTNLIHFLNARIPILLAFSLLFCFSFQALAQGTGNVTVTGELKKWHKIVLSIDGPSTSETSSTNPFTDYRLNVTFTNGSNSFVVPGYFAADGDAAESSASSGNVWRVIFAPNATGTWNYTVSFRTGSNVAASLSNNAGSAVSPVNGVTGSFNVGATDKSAPDLRAKGRLNYVGEHYYQFAETGEYFVKGGVDSPENLLAYQDFDGTVDEGGQVSNFLHAYGPHVSDWNNGDPTWKGGKGKGLIGAINYLSDIGINSVYFLSQNVNGDGDDTWPWISSSQRSRYDCSKLDQWEIAMEHMDHKGLFINLVHQEQENDQLLNGGSLGNDRKIYYRELVARFGHHLAIQWNMGEESTNSIGQIRDFCQYIRDVDPYDRPIVLHTYAQNNQFEKYYGGLLGNPNFDGTSFQINFQGNLQVHNKLKEWIDRSVQAGRKWNVMFDEVHPADTGLEPDADDPGHDDRRKYDLWAVYLAGSGGTEWYVGSEANLPNSQKATANLDRTLEDFRTREDMWVQTRIAREFMETYIPLEEVKNDNSLVSNGLCLADKGNVYLVYLPDGGSTSLDLENIGGTYSVQWFDAKDGGNLQNGSVTQISGTGNKSLGNPPNSPNDDWAILVTNTGGPINTDPIVSFNTPSNNQTFDVGQLINVNVDATDSDDIDFVRLFISGSNGNEELVDQENSAPYDWGANDPVLQNRPEGTYTLRAVATDNAGDTGEASITIIIEENNNNPTFNVSVTNGFGGGAFSPGENVQIEADPAPSGQVFDEWVGDVSFFDNASDKNLVSPIFTMPSQNVSFTATYKNASTGGSTNVALNKSVTATNAQSGNGPNKITDGDPSDGSRWSANGFPQSATIDLGASFSIDEINVSTYQSRAYQYTVAASCDNSNFNTIVNRSNNTTNGNPISNTFAAVDARYIRITVTGASGYNGPWVSLTEVEVFGVPSTGCDGGSNPTFTVNVTNGSGDGTYSAGENVSIQANAAPSGQIFDEWTGDVSVLSNVNTASTSFTMPAQNVSLTATYTNAPPQTFTVSVTNGSGDGTYSAGDNVSIQANAAPSGQVFAAWTGDVSVLSDVNSASTSFTMPAQNVSLTATYENAPTGGRTNVALNKSVTATTAQAGNGPNKITDGDAGNDSRWSANGFPQSVTIDLGASFSIDEIRVSTYLSRAYQYTVAASCDNSSFSTIVNRSNNTTNGNPITNAFAAVDARYVRITVTDASGYGGSWVSLTEVEIFGVSSTGCSGGSNPTFTVDVTNGSGDGTYEAGDNVSIQADAAPSGQVFDEWTGDVSVLSNVNAASTSFTMPSQNVSLTATYENAPTGGSQTVSLSPIHDAHLKNSTRVNNESIRVEVNRRTAYLMFDLSSINGTITDVRLDLVVARDDGNGNMNVIKGQSNNWTENNLSTGNAPSEGATLASLNRTWNIGDPVSIDLNASGLTAGTNNSLILKQTSGNDFGFSSKEGNDAPQLVITYTTGSAAPAPTGFGGTVQSNDLVNNFKLFPNPSSEMITLQFAEAVETVQLLDVSGKVVKELLASDYNLNIQLTNMKAGMYFCRVVYESGTVESQRFVKQ